MENGSQFLSIDEKAVSDKSVNIEAATSNLQQLQKHIFCPKSSTESVKLYANSAQNSVGVHTATAFLKSSKDIPISFTNFDKSLTASPSSSTNCVRSYADDSLDCSTSSSNQYFVADKKSSIFDTKDQIDSSSSILSSSANKKKVEVAMDTGKHIKLTSGRGIFYGRHPSVTDEDLFGDGKKQQGENQVHPYAENIGNEGIQGSTENLKQDNKARSEDSEACKEKDANEIPNFNMLGLSSSSESESISFPKPFEIIEESKMNNENHTEEDAHRPIEFSDGQDSDYKMRFLDGRSISAVEKRKCFRNSSNGEVFDHEIESVDEEYHIGKHIRKSNSLPDLVVSSGHSPLTPPRYHSNQSPKPDVAENLEKHYELKKTMEGSSIMPTTKKRHKIKRTVSYKEDPEYIPADDYDESNDRRSPATKSEETEERRRILSSGYVTGSSEAGSQDKSEGCTSRQTSQMSQESSCIFTSLDSDAVEKPEETVDMKKEMVNVKVKESVEAQSTDLNLLSTHSSGSNERQSVSPVSFGSGGIESNSTEGSICTILDAKTHEVVRMKQKVTNSSNDAKEQLKGETVDKRSAVEMPKLSIMGTPNGSGNSSTFARLKSKDESTGKNLDWGKVSGSMSPKTPDSYVPLSQGNLPNFLTNESFSLNKASLAKVQEEEENDHMVVKKKFCDGEDGSMGVVQPGPSSIPASSRGSSLSNQQSPPEAVKRFEEILMKLGLDAISPGILEKLSQDFRGPDSLSPHNQEKEKNEGSGSQPLKEISVDDLERASRCNFPGCSENCCSKMREVLRVLKLDIPDLDPAYYLVKSYFNSLYQHCEDGCDETKCPVMFCAELNDWEPPSSKDPVKDLVKEAQRYLKNPTMKLFLQTGYKIHKLQSDIQKLELKEFETHIPMFPLGTFGAPHVCMDIKTQQLVVLKMYPLMECDQQLSLYTRLKDLDHPYIVKQLWMLVYEDKLQVCSVFAQGGSLEEYLRAIGGRAVEGRAVGVGLQWPRVVLYMKQILLAVTHLNNLGVVYLNWSSGNMLFPDDRHSTIQVANFSLSCPVKCQCDIGAVKMCLPYNLCPPELFHWNYKANFKSDVWGAGCLFYEMLAGTPFLHELRHGERSIVHERIVSGFQPDTKSWRVEQRNILESCWQKDMEKRWSLVDVLQYLQSIKVR